MINYPLQWRSAILFIHYVYTYLIANGKISKKLLRLSSIVGHECQKADSIITEAMSLNQAWIDKSSGSEAS